MPARVRAHLRKSAAVAHRRATLKCQQPLRSMGEHITRLRQILKLLFGIAHALFTAN